MTLKIGVSQTDWIHYFERYVNETREQYEGKTKIEADQKIDTIFPLS